VRIAYVSDSVLPSPAAAASQTMHMAAAMGRLGHAVRLFAPGHDGRARGEAARAALRDRFALDGAIDLRYLPVMDLRGRGRASYHLVGVLAAKAWRADLVYTRNARIGLLATRAGISVIVESHTLPNSDRSLRAARSLAGSPRLERWAFISDRLRARFAEALGADLPAGRVTIAHDAVDSVRFERPVPRETARRRIGVATDGPLVVHAGHLYPGRGAEALIAAAVALGHVHFVLVGGNPSDVGRVARLAAEAGAPNLRVLGHRDYCDVPDFLFAADVLVMPYTSAAVASDGRTRTIDYASPLKLFEYMAAGRPIVASRFPGVAEVLRDGENALLVPPDHTDALVAALASVVADPALGSRLGDQARGDVAGWTWTARAAAILDGSVTPAFAPSPSPSHRATPSD
jgi:glycosyltransferase involved in cell wall biosynthesis